ncbi:MAG: hypothetical protein UHM08_09230 [Bacteroidales bacterium]|jgi:hypothetical protein|nr:hypothetical protein [Bacteroidales bacterium]
MFNVLKSALNIIPKQTIYYRKFISRTPNEIGNMVNTYGDKIAVIGSIQHAERSLLYKMGIANTEDVYVCYIHVNALGVAEIASNDQIIDKKGEIYNVIDSDVWYDYPVQDWNKVLVRRAKHYDK